MDGSKYISLWEANCCLCQEYGNSEQCFKKYKLGQCANNLEVFSIKELYRKLPIMDEMKNGEFSRERFGDDSFNMSLKIML